jgi:hypothetical protein
LKKSFNRMVLLIEETTCYIFIVLIITINVAKKINGLNKIKRLRHRGSGDYVHIPKRRKTKRRLTAQPTEKALIDNFVPA